MNPFDDNETISLEVIDATLAGEAVYPEHAELAELTLILAGQRPIPDEDFTRALDEQVARRFARPSSRTPRQVRWRWLFTPGAALGALAAVVAVVVLAGGSGLGGDGSSASSSTASSAATAGAGPAVPLRASAGKSAGSPAISSASASGSQASAPAHAQSSSPAIASGQNQSPTAVAAPAPTATGRQIVQSAQLSLSTKPTNVDGVAQQVFDVIAAQNGVVRSSQVTAANNANGYAQFQLSVPSSNLGQTMAALSQLHGANVVSRTDSTRDITQQVGGVGMRLADERALHRALVRKLAAATTTAEIDGLNAQIGAVEARIARLQTSLRSLHRQVNLSDISLTINAAMVPGHPVSSGGGFTLGKAAHDAGRVLVVAAGVALIALAVLVPLGIVIALALWIAHAVRQRRREQALDLV
jgi:Domain of unknown function (DUF4349)